MSGSKNISEPERLMKKVLDEIYPHAEYIDNGFYKDLESSKGAAMSLDRYYPDMKLAFEYRGRQHFMYTPFFHDNKGKMDIVHDGKQGFLDQLERDELKRTYCKKMGIDLFIIRFDEVIDKENIQAMLERRKILKSR